MNLVTVKRRTGKYQIETYIMTNPELAKLHERFFLSADVEIYVVPAQFTKSETVIREFA